MPAKNDMTPRWMLWLVGFIASTLLAVSFVFARGVDADMSDISDHVEKNAEGVSGLKERTSVLETHIQYIHDGVERLERKEGTYKAPPKKR